MRAPATRKTLRPTFTFSAVGATCGALSYDFQLDNSCTPGALGSCAFSSPEVSVRGLTTPTYTPTSDLAVSSSVPVGAMYAWRVRACDATQVCSAWSSVASLHVGRVREDVNGDGYGDIVLMNSTTSLLVYYGGAQADFSTVSATPAVASSSDRVGAFIGDVDGDGYGDIGVMQYYTPTSGYVPAVVFGGSSLTARSPLQLIKSAAGSSLNLWLHQGGDLNGDGFDDFLVDFMYFDPTTELQVFYGGAPLANQAAMHIPCPFAGQYTLSSNGIGDINRDGYSDIAFTEQGNGTSGWTGRFRVFAGGAAPTGTAVADIELVGGHAARVFPAGDLDGDGYGDAAVVETGVGLTLYKGAAAFNQAMWKTLANTSTTTGVAGFNINGDAYSDALLTGGSASIYLGAAAGPSTGTPFPTARGVDQFSGIGFSDHDGDGLPDLVGATADAPFWCASAGTAVPTCLEIYNNGAVLATGSYQFVR